MALREAGFLRFGRVKTECLSFIFFECGFSLQAYQWCYILRRSRNICFGDYVQA